MQFLNGLFPVMAVLAARRHHPHHPDDLGSALAVLAVIGVFAVIVLVSQRLAKKRREGFQRVANELGLEFVPNGSAYIVDSLRQFHLFSQGRNKRTSNLLRGICDGREITLFDYQYTTGSGKSRKTWRSTVVCLQFDGPELPRFALRPERVWDKIGGWFGGQDIDFDHREAFSRHYLLRGDNEKAIRALFTDDVLQFYKLNPGLATEGFGHTFLYYRSFKLVPPEGLRAFLAEGMEALSLYRRTA